MRYNPNPSPVPAGFRETFLAGGWKSAERRYGVSNGTLMGWIAQCGGAAFLAERQAQQAGKPGVRAGGRVTS